MLKCDNVWDKKSPQAITPLTVWHCWVLFLKTNVWSHKQVRLSWQHFPHQSVLTRLHTVLVSKEKPRKRHLWTLLTRRRQVSSPAPATMIFHQHCLHRYQLHCHQTYQSLRCSHHLPKLNDLFLTLEKSLDGWSSNPQHSWPASKYPVCPFTLFAGLYSKNTFYSDINTNSLLSRDDLYQRKSVLEIQDVPGWKSRKSLFTFSIFFGLGWSEQNTLDALLVKHFKVRATKHKSQPVTFERDPAGVFPLTLALFTHSQSFHHTFLIIWH